MSIVLYLIQALNAKQILIYLKLYHKVHKTLILMNLKNKYKMNVFSENITR